MSDISGCPNAATVEGDDSGGVGGASSAAPAAIRNPGGGSVDRYESNRISRRTFVGLGALGGAALVVGSGPVSALARPVSTLSRPNTHRPGDGDDAPFIEATIPELQRLMRRRELSSRELTRAYIDRI